MSRVARSLAALAALALVVTLPLTASAKPVENVSYSGTDQFTTEDCGIEVHVDVTFRGHFIVRPLRGSDQAFLAHDAYEFVETISTDAGSVTVRGKGVFHELRGELVEGTVYEFTSIDAGSFTLYDADGNRLFRGNGVARFSALFDTLGDGQPGGEFIEETSFRFSGNESDVDYCEVFLAELT